MKVLTTKGPTTFIDESSPSKIANTPKKKADKQIKNRT